MTHEEPWGAAQQEVRSIDDLEYAHELLKTAALAPVGQHGLVRTQEERNQVLAVGGVLCWVLGHAHGVWASEILTKIEGRLIAGGYLDPGERRFDGNRPDAGPS